MMMEGHHRNMLVFPSGKLLHHVPLDMMDSFICSIIIVTLAGEGGDGWKGKERNDQLT